MKMVKVSILFIFSLLKWQIIIAQMPSAGSYTTNNTMTPFHGTWQWVSGTDTVKLFLATKKVYYPIAGGFYFDNLVGWHLYKKGNVIIESSYSSINNVDLSTFLGGNSVENPYKIEDGAFNDISKNNKLLNLSLTLNASETQLTWRLSPSHGMRAYANPQEVPPAGITLPRNIVLTKL